MDITRIKKIANRLGLNTEALIVPYYLFPYNFLRGHAFNPIRVVYEVTFRCNLTCQMCPLANWKNNNDNTKQLQSLKDELTTGEIKSFVDELKKLGTKGIMITGGEPFLRNDMLEILDYIKKKQIYCTIISNGTLINDDMAREIAQIGNEVISFSLDGPKEVHNQIRGCGDSFTKIYNTIEKIQSYKNGKLNPKINLNFTISALNQNYITEIVRIACELKINVVNMLYLFYTSSDRLGQTMGILKMGHLKPENQNIPDEIKRINIKVLRESINGAQELAKRYNVKLNFRPPLKDGEIEKRFSESGFSYCSKCFYPWFETRLDPYGNIYPCSIDIPMGNIRHQTLQEIWNSRQYRNFRKSLKKHKLLPACSKCCKLNNKLWSYLPTF